MKNQYNLDNNGNPILDTDDLREEFFYLVRQNITREGIDELCEWLDTTDFFIAPCSTIYHLSCTSGLVAHSLCVYRELCKLMDEHTEYAPERAETVALVALFHDLCKVYTYKPTVKSRKTTEKNAYGKWIWEDYDAYDFAEELPLGHGEKSVYLLSQHIHLTPEEAVAIRWHMGGYDHAAKSDPRTLSNAQQKYPLTVLLHCADAISTMKGW